MTRAIRTAISITSLRERAREPYSEGETEQAEIAVDESARPNLAQATSA
jgi:hypothetical protein